MSIATTPVIICPNVGDNGSSALPVGSILTYAGATAPAGWLMCDGSAVSRSTYAVLFSILGTTYGSGDGSTTFNLPNTANRTIRGKGSNSYGTLGGTGGADTQVISAANLPPHRHGVLQGGGPFQIQSGAATGVQGYNVNTDTGVVSIANKTYLEDGTTLVSNTALPIVNSFLVLNYIIKSS